MKSFATKTIEEVTDTIIDYRGKTPPKTNKGVKLITAKVIKHGFIIGDKHEYIAVDYYDSWMRRGLPKNRDILITTEAPLGEVAQLRKNERVALAQRIILLRGNPTVINQDYFFHALKSEYVQAQLKARSSGTTVPGIKQSELRQVEIPLFSLPIQNQIASILSAYDDLIENNTRRIRLLEEMAQTLYREWFVHFRFPGHKKGKLVDSPLGKIPNGWAVLKFTDVAEVLSGGTPKTIEESYWGGDIPFFTPKDAVNSFYVTGSEKSITEAGLSKCSSKLYPKDTVFITARGTVGKVVMPAIEMAMNQSCYALVGKDDISQLYLFFLTRQATDLLKKNTGGATFDTIIVDTFKRLEVLKPETEPMSLFIEQVEPTFQSIRNLVYTNINLRRTRDLLLPKLISGELETN